MSGFSAWTFYLTVEFLLFFIAVSYIDLVVSQRIKLKYLRSLNLSLDNLRKAERQSVHHLFGEVLRSYSDETLEPLDGITFPVGNTTDPKTWESVCAINDYLQRHLPPIGKTLILNHPDILNNAMAFQIQFKAFAERPFWNGTIDLNKCRREEKDLKDYAKKELVLRIIYFSRKWTEAFIQLYTSYSRTSRP